jgi:hypothetical protein
MAGEADYLADMVIGHIFYNGYVIIDQNNIAHFYDPRL